jgi:hypothetical protein
MGKKRRTKKPGKFSRFTDLVANFDAFGTTPEWNIDGVTNYKTFYGCIVTLAILTACSFYGYWLFRNFFANKGNRLHTSPN